MKIGYKEEDYQLEISHLKNGIYLKENILYIVTLEEFREFIDIKEIINELNIGSSLKGIFIYGNQEEILNINLLSVFNNMTIVYLRNVEVDNLNWLETLHNVVSLTVSNTLGYELGVMEDDFYYPIKYLVNLNYLDVSFSRFSEKALFLSDGSTLVDNMEMLGYLNLRETKFNNDTFFCVFKGKDIVINFIDNLIKLNFNRYENIKLITMITINTNEKSEMVDVSKYIGK